MAQSVLVFISHASDDKKEYIEPIVSDLEDCYINTWIDKRKIIPGENLRKSIFREGLDKADVALIFFTEHSLKSPWVDREIKHVLREELKKGNDFDINKIISIFDSKTTYDAISEKYPELTDDLLHLMPYEYNKVELGQLVSAIWSKYLSLQGGDVETQRQLLAKDKEIFQKEKDIQDLTLKLENAKSSNKNNDEESQFEVYLKSGKLDKLIADMDELLSKNTIHVNQVLNLAEAVAFGLLQHTNNEYFVSVTTKGKNFFQWYLLNHAH